MDWDRTEVVGDQESQDPSMKRFGDFRSLSKTNQIVDGDCQNMHAMCMFWKSPI